MSVFVLPDVGEGLHEAEIVSWHVSAGDHVVADQPLVAVETDKAVVEIPAPWSGRIAELLADVGDVIETGAPLVSYADVAAPDPGAVVGEIPVAQVPEPATLAAVTSKGASASAAVATPAVRATAKRLGVDLTVVEPTGPGGTVTRSDVERAAAGSDAAPAAVAAGEALRGVRRAMAHNMARAHSEVVPATVMDVAQVAHWPDHTDVTLRLIRAVGAGCRAEPALNATFLGVDEGRRFNERVDLGIAVDTDEGLFVPVLRDVVGRDPVDLRRGLDALKADVAARTVPAEELKGQTITLSNFGMHAGRFAQLVVVPPQVAILGAGRIYDEAGRPVLPLSLTFDHRVVTGVEAARFLSAVTADLEDREAEK
jgi:2-oxoisovalerate dehydrogenase E2 component (dihydrolipoyl transacylase)